MEQIILNSITLEELATTIREVVKQELINNGQGQSQIANDHEKYLSRKEVIEILGISLPTLSEWTVNGTLKGYRIGTRIRYRASEIGEAMQVIQKLR